MRGFFTGRNPGYYPYLYRDYPVSFRETTPYLFGEKSRRYYPYPLKRYGKGFYRFYNESKGFSFFFKEKENRVYNEMRGFFTGRNPGYYPFLYRDYLVSFRETTPIPRKNTGRTPYQKETSGYYPYR